MGLVNLAYCRQAFFRYPHSILFGDCIVLGLAQKVSISRPYGRNISLPT
jgi:hypothetical protein